MMLTRKDMFLAFQAVEGLNIQEMVFNVEPTPLEESVEFSLNKPVLSITGSMGLAEQQALSFSVSYNFHQIGAGFDIELDEGLATCTVVACDTHKITVQSQDDLIEEVEVLSLTSEQPSYLIKRLPHLAIPTEISLIK